MQPEPKSNHDTLIWAACDDRGGDPDQYREYRPRLAPAVDRNAERRNTERSVGPSADHNVASPVDLKG